MQNNLKRYIEFAQRITANPDEQQKYTGLCNLMAKTKTDIPNVITANQKAIDGNTYLRLNGYFSDIYFGNIHSDFREQMWLIKYHYSDISIWEQETGDKLKEHQNKLNRFADVVKLPPIIDEIVVGANSGVREHPDPNQKYCINGEYRKWDNQKNSPYFRLFWQIWQQGNTADYETICKMVCLYIALKNEADFIADELRLTGQLPQPQQPNEPTTAQLITDIEQLPQDMQQAIREGIKSQIEAQILVQKTANPDGLNDYLKTELEKATAAMQTLIQESQKDGAIMATINKCFVWNMERAKKLREYLQPTTAQQPTRPTPQPTETTNPLLGNKEFMKVLQRAIKAGFVVASGNGYKCKSLTWLAVFADELNAKGITKTKFADIERLFTQPKGSLTNKFQKAIGQKNYGKMRAEIVALF